MNVTTTLSLKAGAILLTCALAGCSSKVTETKQYSGFIQDYSNLAPAKTASGQEVLRWVAPDFRLSNYKSLYFAPVIYYPKPMPNKRVTEQTLEQVRLYTDQRLRSALGAHIRIASQPEPGGLILKTAIAAVSAENKDLRFYEVLPVTAVVAGTMALSGQRSQNATLFLEAEAVDVSTNETVAKVVRKGYGGSISNSNAPITQADVKGAIDVMVSDVTAYVSN